MKKENRQKGFTLIEVIAVLLIVGILAGFAGLGIVSAVQGYILSKDTAVISEKAMLAMARINRELLECYNCAGTSGPVLSVSTPYFANTLGQRSIKLNGTDIVISDGADTDILLDSVNAFTMEYDGEGSIDIQFIVNHPVGTALTFTSKVYPRNSG